MDATISAAHDAASIGDLDQIAEAIRELEDFTFDAWLAGQAVRPESIIA